MDTHRLIDRTSSGCETRDIDVCARCGRRAQMCENCEHPHQFRISIGDEFLPVGSGAAPLFKGWYCLDCEVEMSLATGARLCDRHLLRADAFVLPETDHTTCARCAWQSWFVAQAGPFVLRSTHGKGAN